MIRVFGDISWSRFMKITQPGNKITSFMCRSLETFNSFYVDVDEEKYHDLVNKICSKFTPQVNIVTERHIAWEIERVQLFLDF